MNTLSPLLLPEAFDRIADDLLRDGYSLCDSLVPAELLWALYERVGPRSRAGFRRAGVGRDRAFRLSERLRSDTIHWLDHDYPAESAYLNWMEQLRLELNQRLMLGLFDFECHFARYKLGAFYKTHLDAFAGQTNRILSSVLYLNPVWAPDWGGELVMYRNFDGEVVEAVAPLFGRLVLFLSERFPHEVKPARRQRYSVAGWYRVRPIL